MVRMGQSLRRRLEFRMALETEGVVVIRRRRPARAYGAVRIVTVDAAQLGITTAQHRVGVFDRVPGGHARGEGRPGAYMATAARPVDVRVAAAEVQLPFLSLDGQVRAAREEFGRRLAAAEHPNLSHPLDSHAAGSKIGDATVGETQPRIRNVFRFAQNRNAHGVHARDRPLHERDAHSQIAPETSRRLLTFLEPCSRKLRITV